MRVVSFDLESYRIRPGLAAPKSVCLSWDDGETQGVVLAGPGSEGLRKFWGWIKDDDVLLVGHNVFYDLGLLCADDEKLIPWVFYAFGKGRIRCTMIRAMMLANADGELKFEWDEDLEEFKKARFNLERCAWVYLKEFIKGKGKKKKGKKKTKVNKKVLAPGITEYSFDEVDEEADTADAEVDDDEFIWRMNFSRLDGVPVTKWPKDAYDYSLFDSIKARQIFLKQEEIVEPEGIPGEIGQTCKAWALNLMSMHGVRTNGEAVDKLEAELRVEYEEKVAVCQGLGLVRDNAKRSRDMKAIRARIVAHYTACGLKDAIPYTPGRKNKEGKRVPQVATDRETLTMLKYKSAPKDEGLEAVSALVKVQKLLSTYVKVLKWGTKYPITPHYNAIIETFRTSCVAMGTLIEVVRDVSKQPFGVPIEDVKIGDLIYAYDHKRRLVLRKVTWAGKTGHRQVVRVHWRAGRGRRGYVDLTPEHRVRRVDGSYCEAGYLEPGDQVMALARGLSNGYARLWPTGAPEITREHRFIYESLHGRSASHVHHDNENKLDNRPENLIGMGRSEHLKHHGANTSADLRAKRSRWLHRSWCENRQRRMATIGRGASHPGFRGFSKEQLVELLWKHKGQPTLVAKELGTDYATLQKYFEMYGIEYLDIARSFTAKGVRITADRVEEWRKMFDGSRRTRDVLKEIGLGYYTWKRAQEQFGHVAHNHVVEKIEVLPGKVPVYDLSIEEDHNFIAGEICVHNCSKPNLQNPPRKGDVRSCFVPREGCEFAFCDYDTLELRTLAQVCLDLFGESVLAETFRAGKDPHVMMAANTLGMSYDEAFFRYENGDPVIDNARQYSKIANYGFGGGMGPDAFIDYARGYGIEVTSAHAQELWLGFRNTFTEMYRYFKYCANETGETGEALHQVFVRTGMVRGRVRYTAYCNGNFQHLAAVGAGAALFQAAKEMYVPENDAEPEWRRSALYGCRAWLFAHDEIGLEIPTAAIGRAAASRAAERLRQVMIDKMKEWVPDVPIGASVAMCRKWLKGAKGVRVDGCLVPSKPYKDAEGKTTWVADLDEDELPPSPRLGRFAKRPQQEVRA